MSVSFMPKGLFTQTTPCACVKLYEAHDDRYWQCHDGHPETCEGHLPVGEVIPELNLSNRNAVRLFELLSLPEKCEEFQEYGCGSIDAAELLCAVSGARVVNKQEFAIEAVVEHGDSGVVCYNGGLPVERLDYYLEQLAEVANYAMEHEVPVDFA